MSRQRINVMTTGKRNMGDTFARRTEQEFKLPSGWFDSRHPEETQLQQLRDVAQYLTQQQIALLIDLARQMSGVIVDPVRRLR